MFTCPNRKKIHPSLEKDKTIESGPFAQKKKESGPKSSRVAVPRGEMSFRVRLRGVKARDCFQFIGLERRRLSRMTRTFLHPLITPVDDKISSLGIATLISENGMVCSSLRGKRHSLFKQTRLTCNWLWTITIF